MTSGYNKPLYILPFDHRASFSKEMFGWEGMLNADQVAQIAAVKRVIFDAVVKVVASGGSKEHTGILVDEQCGASILRDAATQGLITCCPAEKSGQHEFDFEYGSDYPTHIEAFNPTFCKVLVRYNPGGDKEMNRRQGARLKQLSEYLHANNRRYMFELLVPAEVEQLKHFDNDLHSYDTKLRPILMVQAIHELQDSGVEPDVWKIEGLDRREDCKKVVAAARRAGRDQVGCIVLGRHESDDKVEHWLTTAASTPGFIGFAVGRTTFWDPLIEFRAHRITRDAAMARIAASFRKWIDTFEKIKKTM